MKETFETVLGKPVEVALIDSIKRGAQTCRFTISQIAPAGSQASGLNSEGKVMSIRKVLLLGNPKLYESCAPVVEGEIESLRPVVRDLHDTLMDFRRRHGVGRAIAAPQIGIMTS
jgi:hypothetical protein